MTKIVSYALIFFPLVHVSAVVERMNGATQGVATLVVACWLIRGLRRYYEPVCRNSWGSGGYSLSSRAAYFLAAVATSLLSFLVAPHVEDWFQLSYIVGRFVEVMPYLVTAFALPICEATLFDIDLDGA